MLTRQAAAEAAPRPPWIQSAAYDRDGALIGRVADVLFGPDRAPAWLLLDLGPSTDRPALAPARGLRHRTCGVQLACDAARVRRAPRSTSPPDALADEHARALAAHYGVRCGPGPWRGVLAITVRNATA